MLSRQRTIKLKKDSSDLKSQRVLGMIDDAINDVREIKEIIIDIRNTLKRMDAQMDIYLVKYAHLVTLPD